MVAIKKPGLKVLGIFIFFTLVVFGYSEEVFHPGERWGVHPPVTWELLSAEPQLTSFSDIEGRAIFQVFTFSPGIYTDITSLNSAIIQSLDANVEQAPFVYTTPEALGSVYRGETGIRGTPGIDLSGTPVGGQVDALFSDMSWTAGRLELRGYGIFLAGGEEANSYVILAFSLEEWYDVYHDFLLSVLDSFQPWMNRESDYLRAPGPVSQFFDDPVPLALFNGELLQGDTGRMDDQPRLSALAQRGDATQVVIEREARILSQFQEAPAELQLEAWRRFYQLIYRDSFADMAGTAKQWFNDLAQDNQDPRTWPAPILTRLQGFDYRRIGNLSDLESPQIAVLENAGDCDTLVLTYLSLLEHAGIEGIIMISTKHAHSLAGVGSGISGNAGANARFPFLGQDWLVAELTYDVDLGLIAASMADPEDWFGFHLGFNP